MHFPSQNAESRTFSLSFKLRGGAQLGKTIKGRTQSNAKQETEVNEEEKRLQESIQRMEMMDYMHRLAVSKKSLLNDMLAKEEQMSRTNQLKIQSHWRQMMRSIKMETLQKQIEILSQTFECDLDRKDATIQMLYKDLEEAEQQFLTCIHSHFTHIDDLIEMQDERWIALEKEFELDWSDLERTFAIERQQLIEQHTIDKEELIRMMEIYESQEKEREAESRQEHEQHREEIRNKNSEEFNVLRITLDSSIEELEQHFENAHLTYLQNTDQRTQDFKYLTNKDQELSRDIELKVRKMERLQNSIAHWRTKIAQNGKEGMERNAAIENEKKIVLSHFRKLKGKMTTMRNKYRKELIQYSDKAHQTKALMDQRLEMLERILRLGELVQKLENEQERMFLYSNGTLEEERQADELTESIRLSVPLLDEQNGTENDGMLKEFQPECLLPNGKIASEWEALGSFWKRMNKVILDEFVLKREKERLEKENEELQAIVKHFMDGMTVNDEVMCRANSLLMVEGKLQLFRLNHGKSTVQTSVIDANHMIQTNRYGH